MPGIRDWIIKTKNTVNGWCAKRGPMKGDCQIQKFLNSITVFAGLSGSVEGAAGIKFKASISFGLTLALSIADGSEGLEATIVGLASPAAGAAPIAGGFDAELLTVTLCGSKSLPQMADFKEESMNAFVEAQCASAMEKDPENGKEKCDKIKKLNEAQLKFSRAL